MVSVFGYFLSHACNMYTIYFDLFSAPLQGGDIDPAPMVAPPMIQVLSNDRVSLPIQPPAYRFSRDSCCICL